MRGCLWTWPGMGGIGIGHRMESRELRTQYLIALREANPDQGLKSRRAACWRSIVRAERANQLLDTEGRRGEQGRSLGALGIQASQESDIAARRDTRCDRDQAVV